MKYNLRPSNSLCKGETIKIEIDRCLKGLIESIEECRVLIPIESFKLEEIPELRIGNVRFIEY